MKKLILSAAALFAFGFAQAQETTEGGKGFSNGDIFMTGSVGFSSTSTGDDKANEFTFSPSAGMFVTDNIAIGLELSISSATEEDGFSDELKTSQVGIAAFGRYYTTPASDFSFFAQLGVGYVSVKAEQGPNEIKANGFGVEFNPGVSYFISENFALQATIGALSYSSVEPDFDGAESTDNFELNLNLSDIQLGLVYKF